MDPTPPLIEHLPDEVSADTLLEGFLSYALDVGLELYPAQEEAILEIFAGNNVILNTPTGSGKSLVAVAAHFATLAEGGHCFYTAPIKALVSEKFFELCRVFGSDNVGMLTGDASVNPSAPIICCTAEILANLALREGDQARVDHVVMDEFHYYADRDRGWAWQVPLLELPQATFLLMSATLGSTAMFEEDLTRRTGRPTALVKTAQRPVPLDFVYRVTPLLESIEELLAEAKTPTYIVHFTQRSAIERAQSLTSLSILTKDEKDAVKDAIGGFAFDSVFGKDLKRYVLAGIGVHHAGLLPKYRLLVEKLAQAGHLKLICGTDTLGVGINVPIRTVLFTQLCKYDGRRTRILTVRDFKQIAGRAGRKGFDDEGSVWVQAPEHWIENRSAELKVADDAKKKRKLVKKKPPERGYAHWSEDTLDKLKDGDPEPLTSSFDVSHAMMLNVLDRPGDGGAAMRRLLVDNHEPRAAQRNHIRRAISIYRSLLNAEIIEILDEPDELGRMVRVHLDLQDDFRLNQPLALFAVEAVEILESDGPDSVELPEPSVDRGAASEHRHRSEEPQRPDRQSAGGGRDREEPDVEPDSQNPFSVLDGLVLEDDDELPLADADEAGTDESVAPEEIDTHEANTGEADTDEADADEVGADEVTDEPALTVQELVDAPDATPAAERPRGPSDAALDVLTVIEAVLEDPGVLLAAQLDRIISDLMNEWKSSGVEYEERMARLEKVERPKPLEDVLYAIFNIFAEHHPWVGGETIKPKSIARDMWERAMTFSEYVSFYGLKRAEGVLLRYLSDAYKGMVQTVPESAKTDEVYELTEWLGAVVRQVDSSLIDEWERLKSPDPEAPTDEIAPSVDTDITTNRAAFEILIRNEMFKWVMLLGRKRYADIAKAADSDLDEDELRARFVPYWDEHGEVLIDTEARNKRNVTITATGPTWRVEQTICDPAEYDEWRLIGDVDLEQSIEENRAVVRLVDAGRVG